MKVWLDDLRDPKDFGREDCVWVISPIQVIKLFIRGEITFISFDHDLGENVPTGYDVAELIEYLCCAYPAVFSCPEWEVHSANPVGRGNIKAAMTRAENFYRIWGNG